MFVNMRYRVYSLYRSNGVCCLVHRPAKQRTAEARWGRGESCWSQQSNRARPNLFRTGSHPARCQRRRSPPVLVFIFWLAKSGQKELNIFNWPKSGLPPLLFFLFPFLIVMLFLLSIFVDIDALCLAALWLSHLGSWLWTCRATHSLLPLWEHRCTVGFDRDPPV